MTNDPGRLRTRTPLECSDDLLKRPIEQRSGPIDFRTRHGSKVIPKEGVDDVVRPAEPRSVLLSHIDRPADAASRVFDCFITGPARTKDPWSVEDPGHVVVWFDVLDSQS